MISYLSCSMGETSFSSCILNCSMPNKAPNCLQKQCTPSSPEIIAGGPMFTMINFRRRKFWHPNMGAMVRKPEARTSLTLPSLFPDTWLPMDYYSIPDICFRNDTGTEPSLPFTDHGTGLPNRKKDIL